MWFSITKLPDRQNYQISKLEPWKENELCLDKSH